jgi:dihydrodipicolinate synthase/N-acetylneuraminate lyase
MELYDQGDGVAARELHETVKRFRLALQTVSPIPAQKRLLAIATGDARWANVRPPLIAMSDAAGRELATELKRDHGFSLSVSARTVIS